MGKMGRKPWYDKNGMKKGAWSQEEDYKLRSYIQKHGHWNWRQLPKFAGLARCGKSCRLRWLNYLRQDVKRGNFSEEEERLIIELRGKYGNKWCEIASKLPGRTDNEVKNYWHSKLKKKVEEDQSLKKIECSIEFGKVDPIEAEELDNNLCNTESYLQYVFESSSDQGFFSLDYETLLMNNMYANDTVGSFEEYSEPTVDNFWTQPFLYE